MKLYITTVPGKVLLFLLTMDLLKVIFFPSINLLLWAVFSVVFDLITGVLCAHIRGELVLSTGARKTLNKLIQYIGVIGVCFTLSNIVASNEAMFKETLSFFGTDLYSKTKYTFLLLNNLVVLLIIYIESISILENGIGIDKTSMFSKYVMTPLHKVLTLAVVHNVIRTIARQKD